MLVGIIIVISLVMVVVVTKRERVLGISEDLAMGGQRLAEAAELGKVSAGAALPRAKDQSEQPNYDLTIIWVRVRATRRNIQGLSSNCLLTLIA